MSAAKRYITTITNIRHWSRFVLCMPSSWVFDWHTHDIVLYAWLYSVRLWMYQGVSQPAGGKTLRAWPPKTDTTHYILGSALHKPTHWTWLQAAATSLLMPCTAWRLQILRSRAWGSVRVAAWILPARVVEVQEWSMSPSIAMSIWVHLPTINRRCLIRPSTRSSVPQRSSLLQRIQDNLLQHMFHLTGIVRLDLQTCLSLNPGYVC